MSAPHRRTCVVLQPGYLPWLGFFEQVDQADEFIYLDDVQFDKHGWRNRNRIKGPDGPQWLTVPVRVGGLRQPLIRDVEIDQTQGRWAVKHLHALQACYDPCPFFDWLFPDLRKILQQRWTHIADLDIALVDLLCAKLGIHARFRRSSELNAGSDRSGRLVEMCRQLDCNHYHSGAAARDYLDARPFNEVGVSVGFQDYVHPEYPQRWPPFVSHLSVVDLLFNCGPDSAEILMQGQGVAAGLRPGRGPEQPSRGSVNRRGDPQSPTPKGWGTQVGRSNGA